MRIPSYIIQSCIYTGVYLCFSELLQNKISNTLRPSSLTHLYTCISIYSENYKSTDKDTMHAGQGRVYIHAHLHVYIVHNMTLYIYIHVYAYCRSGVLLSVRGLGGRAGGRW